MAKIDEYEWMQGRLSRTEWQREKEREEMKKKGADNMKLVGSPFIMISEILLIGQISVCLARRSGEQVKPRGRKTSKTLTRHERDATERPSLMKFVMGYATENVPSTKNGNYHTAEVICTILLKKNNTWILQQGRGSITSSFWIMVARLSVGVGGWECGSG